VTWPTPAVAAFDEQTTATLSASARPPEAVLETPAEPNRPRRRRSLVLAAFLAAGILGGATTFTAFSLLPDSGTTVALTPPATISQTETGPEPEPAATPERAPAAPAADPADVRVQVLDGAGSEARIDAAVAALEDLGYRVTAGQAALPFNTTTVYYGDDTRDAATALRDADTRFTRILARQPGFDDTYDVHVVVGTDWPLPPGQEDLAAAPTGTPDPAAAPAPPAAAPPAAVPAAPAPPGSYGTATLQVPGWVAILDSVFPDGTLPATDLPRQGPFAYADVLGYAGNFERAGIATTVFNSSTYSSLRPGLWVIAVPGFASGDAAEGYCATVAAVAPDCYPRYVDY
jgi:hypothetical protein